MRTLHNLSTPLLVLAFALAAAPMAPAERPHVVWQIGGHSEGIMGLKFSPDGGSLASGSSDGTVKLWDVQTGELQLSLTGTTFAARPRFSPDGARMFFALGGGGEEWNIDNAGLKNQYQGLVTGGLALQSPDGRFVAVGGRLAFLNQLETIVFDHATGQELYRADGGFICAFSPDSSKLFVAGMLGITMYIAETGQPIIANATSGEPASIAVSQAADIIAVGTDSGTIDFFDPELLVFHGAINAHTDGIAALAFSPDGSRIASAGADGTVKVWRMDDFSLVHTVSDHVGPLGAVAWSPDGSLLATGGGGVSTVVGNDRAVRLRDAATGELLQQFTRIHRPIHDLTIDDAGQLIAGALTSLYHRVRIWRAADGELLHEVSPADAPVLVELSPEGELLATGGFEGTVSVFDTQDGSLVTSWQAHARPLHSLAWQPDGSVLITNAPPNEPLTRWDPLTGANLGTISIDDGHLKFSPDGSLLAGKGSGRVSIFDAETGAFIHGLPTGISPREFEFSGDGDKLISVSSTGITVFDSASGESLRTLPGAAAASALALSHTGRIAAGASAAEREIRIWDVASGDPIAVYHSDFGSFVTEMFFSPDDRKLYLSRRDGTLLALRVPGCPNDATGTDCDTDLDNDCRVDNQDLGMLLAAYLAVTEDTDFNPDADFDRNGVVSNQDLGMLLADYLNDCN